MSDNTEDALLALVETCDRNPAKGLEWISTLGEQRHSAVVMFARVIALGRLALDRLQGMRDIASVDLSTLRSAVTADQFDLAIEAICEIRSIEREHPHYLESLDEGVLKIIDDIGIVIERLSPGRVAKVLGWTKLWYFGTDRIRIAPNIFVEVPNEFVKRVLRTKFDCPIPIAAAVVSHSGVDAVNGPWVWFALLERSYDNPHRTLGDLGIVGTATAFDTGTIVVRFHRSPSDSHDLPDAETRSTLLAEAKMQLRLKQYIRDPARIRYLEGVIAWLEGRGPKPTENDLVQF